MATILLLEDDPVLGEALKLNLELENHSVLWAKTVEDARHLNETEKLQLAILDISLPDGNGLEFCREMREQGSRLPIIILTAEEKEDIVVEAFDSGANDYVKKPFRQRELIARIRAALRESVIQSEKLRAGELLLILNKREAYIDGEPVNFNRREFDLVSLMAKRHDSVVTREAMIESLGDAEDISDRTIDSHISHIRAKIKATKKDKVRIRSEYGVGYRLVTKW